MPEPAPDPSLDAFRIPMQPICARMQRAAAQGVRAGTPLLLAEAQRLLEPGDLEVEDGVYRQPDGMLCVCARTELPGVTGAMIDWWFGWHLTHSERYRLWHPKAHLRSRPREDRSALADDRARYVGNVSYVDEYVGRALFRLAIEFAPPERYGLERARFAQARVGTAVCARVALRRPAAAIGHLVHLVRETDGGAEMRSRFWLGDIEPRVPVVGGVARALVNTRLGRHALVPDRQGVDLLVHCAEEMSHLARFLPALYAQKRGA